jgi:hypothetical protein
MGMLSRDDILAADDIETEIIDVPEWGGKVMVRSMTGAQRDQWEASMMERRGRRMVPNTFNVRAKLAVWCIVGENGERVFTDADAVKLGAKSAAAINRVYEAAAKMSGITDDDVDELVENFGKTPGAVGSSGELTSGDAPSNGSSPPPPAGS